MTSFTRTLVPLAALALTGGCTVAASDDDSKGTGGSSASAGGAESDGGDETGGTAGAANGSGGRAGEAADSGARRADAESEAGGDTDGGIDGGGGTGGEDAGTTTPADAGPDATGVVRADHCDTAEVTPNEDRDHSTPYTVDTAFEACLQNEDDVDFYEFTVPSEPAQGGFIIVKLTNVGENSGLDAMAYSAADNGEIGGNYATRGQSVFFWLNVVPGGTYRLRVQPWSTLRGPTPYEMLVEFTGVPDDNEPNDLRGQAADMTLGTPIQGYFFAGYENSTAIPDPSWEDWFKITLPDGDVQMALTDLAADVAGAVTFYDSLGAQIQYDYEATRGGSVVRTYSVSSGDYYFKIEPWSSMSTKGNGSNPAAYLTQPYTLTVTTL